MSESSPQPAPDNIAAAPITDAQQNQQVSSPEAQLTSAEYSVGKIIKDLKEDNVQVDESYIHNIFAKISSQEDRMRLAPLILEKNPYVVSDVLLNISSQEDRMRLVPLILEKDPTAAFSIAREALPEISSQADRVELATLAVERNPSVVSDVLPKISSQEERMKLATLAVERNPSAAYSIAFFYLDKISSQEERMKFATLAVEKNPEVVSDVLPKISSQEERMKLATLALEKDPKEASSIARYVLPKISSPEERMELATLILDKKPELADEIKKILNNMGGTEGSTIVENFLQQDKVAVEAAVKAKAEAKAKKEAEAEAEAQKKAEAPEERARKEKAVADAKLKAEREAKEKLEAELKAKAEAEAEVKREAEKAADEPAQERPTAATTTGGDQPTPDGTSDGTSDGITESNSNGSGENTPLQYDAVLYPTFDSVYTSFRIEKNGVAQSESDTEDGPDVENMQKEYATLIAGDRMRDSLLYKAIEKLDSISEELQKTIETQKEKLSELKKKTDRRAFFMPNSWKDTQDVCNAKINLRAALVSEKKDRERNKKDIDAARTSARKYFDTIGKQRVPNPEAYIQYAITPSEDRVDLDEDLDDEVLKNFMAIEGKNLRNAAQKIDEQSNVRAHIEKLKEVLQKAQNEQQRLREDIIYLEQNIPQNEAKLVKQQVLTQELKTLIKATHLSENTEETIGSSLEEMDMNSKDALQTDKGIHALENMLGRLVHNTAFRDVGLMAPVQAIFKELRSRAEKRNATLARDISDTLNRKTRFDRAVRGNIKTMMALSKENWQVSEEYKTLFEQILNGAQGGEWSLDTADSTSPTVGTSVKSTENVYTRANPEASPSPTVFILENAPPQSDVQNQKPQQQQEQQEQGADNIGENPKETGTNSKEKTTMQQIQELGIETQTALEIVTILESRIKGLKKNQKKDVLRDRLPKWFNADGTLTDKIWNERMVPGGEAKSGTWLNEELRLNADQINKLKPIIANYIRAQFPAIFSGA